MFLPGLVGAGTTATVLDDAFSPFRVDSSGMIYVENNGDDMVYVGGDREGLRTSGLPIKPGGRIELLVAPETQLYGIGDMTVRAVEYG